MRILPSLAALFLMTTAALAHGVSHDTLEVIHPNIPKPAASAKSAAGYMAIANSGAEADRLIAVETPFAKSAQVHTTETGADGVARMIHLPDGVEIPAGDTVVLEPGGMHIMLMGLTGTLTEGDMVAATLVFEHAGPVAVEFMVDPAGGMDHSTMDHSATDAAVGHESH